MMTIALLLFGVFLTSTVHAALQTSPTDACHTYECPLYEVLEAHEGYELRRYEPSTWAVTEAPASSLYPVGVQLYMRLFRYRRGNNTLGQRLDMTLPVLRKITTGASRNTYTYYYMLPEELAANPPQPTESTIRFENYPRTEFFARSYTEDASNTRFETEVGALKSAIGDRDQFETSSFFVAAFDRRGTYREVMLKKRV